MFKTLSDSFEKVLGRLRGYGKLTESNVGDALRDVRMALLEADVNYQVARDFVERVRTRCLGREVLESLSPGQQVVKEVHDELVALLGGTPGRLELDPPPGTVLLLGLHGVGKTTTTAKLAAHLKRRGKKVVLAACDIRRPAAVEQLQTLASAVGVPVVAPAPDESVPDIGRRALRAAREQLADAVLLDTGGRLHLDDDLVEEVRRLREAVAARNVLLVVDAAMGRDSVRVAQEFHGRVGLTGLVLTKLDSDARGGAALSIRAVTGCPVLFCGTGEHLEDLEAFHPERMASRILQMGDIVGLVEKVQERLERVEAADVEAAIGTKRLNLEDFLGQLRQIRKMGPVENLLEMLPIPAKFRSSVGVPEGEGLSRFVVKAEAVILSMTPRERRRPDIIDGSRRRRIAAGSGTSVSDVNDVLRRFNQARKMAKQMRRLRGRRDLMQAFR